MKKQEEEDKAENYQRILQNRLYKRYCLLQSLQGKRLVDTLADIDEHNAYSKVEIEKQSLGQEFLKSSLILFKDPNKKDNELTGGKCQLVPLFALTFQQKRTFWSKTLAPWKSLA